MAERTLMIECEIDSNGPHPYIEVFASGAALVNRIRELGVSRLSHVGPNDRVYIGSLDAAGNVWEEWFELGLGNDWIRAVVPDHVKARIAR